MSDLGVVSRHALSGVAAWWAPETMRTRGERAALHLDGVTVSYSTLAARVETRMAELGTARRLVALAGGNDLEFIVTYLAALAAGHPLILLPPGPGEADLLATYRPDVVVRTDPSTSDIDRRRAEEPRELHPDLALLLTTSGSTGTRKLVRLSSDNIATNAVQIADYLRLSTGDVGITSLPLHYCYGLSVLNSHLAVGASVAVTTSSVVDPCFWDAVRRAGVTNLAGVPHTFELIERIGVDTLDAPSLRAVMQAGGRMPPEAVRRFSELGVQRGWDFYVMYGQTEATARMAYLPPDLAQSHPAAIGIPVPGGSFDLADVPETAGHAVRPGEAVGELVYRGPNVMLGYAECPADLAAGRVVDELRTGDLARRDTDGLYTIVGRRSRFLKVHGHRIDLGEVERIAGEAVDAGPGDVVATGRDERLLIATCTGDPGVLRRRVAGRLGMPAKVIGVAALDELPRTERGKPDYAAISSAVEQLDPAWGAAVPGTGMHGADADGVDAVAREFAAVLDRPVSPDDTFVGLGGDSFSYVELSVRLEERLADLPTDWHLQSVGALARLPRRRSRLVAVETSVVLRAVGIMLIVCTHMHLYRLPGGAHLLLAVAGFNFARFQLAPGVGHRLRRGLATVGRVAIPTTAWIGVNMAIAGGYSVGALFLVNNYFGSPWRRDGRWQYWYFEAFVQIVLVLVIVFAVPAVRRVEARYPFGVAGVVLGASMLLRFDVVQLGDDYNALFRPHTVLCFFALGWCAQRAVAGWQKVAVTAAALTVFGYFDQQFDRELRIALAVVALVWVARVPLPRLLARAVGVLAATSMYIFLVHWQVWPVLDRNFEDHVAFVLTVAVGVIVGLAADRAWRGAREVVGRACSAKSSMSGSSTPVRSARATDRPLRTV